MTSKPAPAEHQIEDSLPPYNRDDHEYPTLLRGESNELEALTPKPPRSPRWFEFWRFSTRAKVILGAVLLALVALIASMIWYGIHRSKMLPDVADLSAAKNLVEPKVLTSLAFYDGDLLTPFDFSPPTISNATFYPSSTAYNTVNATVLTSSSQLIQLPTPLNSSTAFVKIFGNRSTDVVFASSLDNSTDWKARVEAFWKVSPGGNQEDRVQWGVDQLSRVVGGSYGYKLEGSDGDSAAGLAMKTDGNDKIRNSLESLIVSRPDNWLDSSILFNVTILVPSSFYAAHLEVFSTANGDLNFLELNNATFDTVDVRLPLGYVGLAHVPLLTRSLNIFTGRGIGGSYSLLSGTLLSHGPIQSEFTFPPAPSSSSPYNLTLVSTNGYITANVTSFNLTGSHSTSPALHLNATSLSPSYDREPKTYVPFERGTKVYFPLDGYEGSFKLASNKGLPIVAWTPVGTNWRTVWGGGSVADGKLERMVEGRLEREGKPGMVRLDGDTGDVGLSVGHAPFFNY